MDFNWVPFSVPFFSPGCGLMEICTPLNSIHFATGKPTTWFSLYIFLWPFSLFACNSLGEIINSHHSHLWSIYCAPYFYRYTCLLPSTSLHVQLQVLFRIFNYPVYKHNPSSPFLISATLLYSAFNNSTAEEKLTYLPTSLTQKDWFHPTNEKDRHPVWLIKSSFSKENNKTKNTQQRRRSSRLKAHGNYSLSQLISQHPLTPQRTRLALPLPLPLNLYGVRFIRELWSECSHATILLAAMGLIALKSITTGHNHHHHLLGSIQSLRMVIFLYVLPFNPLLCSAPAIVLLNGTEMSLVILRLIN